MIVSPRTVAVALLISCAAVPTLAQDVPDDAPPADTLPRASDILPSPSEPSPSETPVDPPDELELPAPGSEAAAPDPAERMRMIVIDAATFGIDPVVGRVATARMRATGEEMGYAVLTPDETIAAAQQLRMPYPPTPADLWRVSWISRSHRGVFARIWAHAGQYVIEITVASLDGAGPFFARGTSGADDLRDVVDRLLRTALPPPSAWNPAGAPPGITGAAGAGTSEYAPPAGTSPLPADPGGRIDELDEDELDSTRPRRRGAPEPELRRWQLTLQTEGAIGAAQDVFYNHLLGVRFDFRITRDILIGVYAAYANLNARNGRADNMLFMAQFENRIRISPDLDLTIPLRVAAGYLPFNGPVIRLSAGVNYAISPDFEIGVDILTPTFWVLPDRTAVSLNIAIEGTYRF